MPATLSIHRHTPSLTASDPRGLPVRAVGYWRDIDGVPPQARVNRTAHDWAGRAIAQRDPRLFPDASAAANLQTTYALSGAVLSTDSVDAGWRVALLGEAGQSLHTWDSRGSQRRMRYDALLRPVLVFEQAVDGDAICTERLGYGASDQASAERNQCGQLIRHDDPAGTQRFTESGLHGAVLEQTRHFLKAVSLPDWPEPVADRELLLEPGEGAITRSQVNALGEVSQQTDAKGHRQLFHQTLDGQLREVRLQLNGTSTPKTLVSAIDYNAHGQTEREVAGNGVIATLEYDTQNGRLTRLQVRRGNTALQDLRYAYDPVGNVLSIEDAALPIRYFANQRIEPVNRYAYDSLGQLIEATGWEAGGPNKGPQFSTLDDPAPRANYRQTYHYDAGGNLLELVHEGPQSHGHRLVAAAHSNRCLLVLEGVEPGEEDFRNGFDGNGNLLNLQPGRALSWDLRNQLSEVRPVEREGGEDDNEHYVYGADGMRVRKIRSTQTNARTLLSEVRYLPNLELRTHAGTGEVLQVINVQAGRSSVRVLHWESVPPNDNDNDQLRYSLSDHLGSCALELDSAGEVISQERYHPFGTTAWFAGRGEVEASYKTVRYSGKERDATGLYYYGFRYYIAWWQRWLSPDPAGSVDGLNFYCMVRNNPASLKDSDGRESNFKELFKPEHGDLIFGLSSVVRKRYLSWFAKLTYRGDVLAMYFTRKDAGNLASSLGRFRSAYYEAKFFMRLSSPGGREELERVISAGSHELRERATVNVQKGNDFWRKKHARITSQIVEIENRFYDRIKSSQSSIASSKVYWGFSKEFASELAGGRYSANETFQKYIDAEGTVFYHKFLSRASKAGLSTILKSEGGSAVHFILDELDMNQVVKKTQPSLTSSELRYLYRNRSKVVDKVLFYQQGKLVDAPWRTDRALWSQYIPKNTSGGTMSR
ncbi:RHS repeat-associated core domain-containing protein [Pseudomonas sp. Pseusp3]|uniref:RHS repeat-associated core domain-containing protein n=1 Tax=Pseudomonas sp. Pseusp3 TaxID=3243029 RepID=UPI0039AF400F